MVTRERDEMATGDPKPWHREPPDSLLYRASALRVLVGVCPVIAAMLALTALQYVFTGAVSHGMWWVLGSFAAFTLAAVLALPRVSYLEFTPRHFTLREPAGRTRVAWADIEPGSIGYVVRTFLRIPLLTNIGFRLMPGSRHLTTLRVVASAATGMHVYFMNLYAAGRDEIVDTLRRYQAWYGATPQRAPGAPAGPGEDPAEPVSGDPAAPGPRYNLVVLNDDTHTYDDVERLLREALGASAARAAALTRAIDRAGRAVVFTGSLEEVTRARDRLLSRGPDGDTPQSAGPLGVEVKEVG